MRRSLAVAVERALSRAAPSLDFFPFEGGLDLVSSPLSIVPGRVVEAQNFESTVNGGYRRIKGYERHDGRPKPSDAQYAILNVTITGAFAVNDTITGVTSGATAVVVAVVTSGTPDYLVITKISGTFINPETLNVGGSGQGTTSSEATVDGASTAQLHAQYKNLAADEYRDDIGAVPGSGVVRGAIRHGGVTYAFRNNAGGTATELYKSSVGGWVAVSLGEQVSFTAGGGDIDEGDTLTQGGVTATVKRVVITSGTLAGGTAAGKLILSGRAGGNYAAGAATTTGAGVLTLSGAQTAITLQPNGRYEFVKENFGGAANTTRIYGCDGVNKGFEFDGTVYVPIDTGMTTDAPSHVAAHKKHLFFSFVGSVQHSGTGTPYVFTVLLGASEIAMGDTVTGFAVQPGVEASAALAIFTRNRTSILYGTSSANWNLVPYRAELGAYGYTIQDIGFTIFLDDRGITNLVTAQSFGNFAHAALTYHIHTLVNEKRLLATASCISRDRSQYRIFFSDGSALYFTFVGKKLIAIMPELFPDIVRCAYSGEEDDGSEIAFFGSDAGFVYEMEKGTSFDGDAIEYYFVLPFHFIKSPRTKKRYHGGLFEMTGEGYAEFNFSFSLSYASGEQDVDTTLMLGTNFSSSGRWDVGVWDVGIWDGRTLIPTEFDLTGSAENIALRVSGSADYFEPFTFHGVMMDYAPRRKLRV